MRAWYEPPQAGSRELRIQVKHVLTGDTRYFRDWAACWNYIASVLDEPQQSP